MLPDRIVPLTYFIRISNIFVGQCLNNTVVLFFIFLFKETKYPENFVDGNQSNTLRQKVLVEKIKKVGYVRYSYYIILYNALSAIHIYVYT